MSLTQENKKQLMEDIKCIIEDLKKLEKNDVLMEIGKIIIKDDNKVTENIYGCLFDLGKLKDVTLTNLKKYLDFYNEKQEELSERFVEKN